MWRPVTRLIVPLLTASLVGACQSGGSASSSPGAPSPQAAGAGAWPAGVTLAVYDGPAANGHGHTVYVVGLQGSGTATARVLATATLASRTELPAPACKAISACSGPVDPQYVSTSAHAVYVLDGDSAVDVLRPGGTLSKVRSIPGTASSRAAFAVSPDDALIAVGVIDFLNGTSRLFVENLQGGGHIDVRTSTGGQIYWPVGWYHGRIVLASGTVYGATRWNPYGASGYAVVDAASQATPSPIGRGDCIPSGTVVAVGSACINDPGVWCIEEVVANPESTPYYNSCLRSLTWSGQETTFLVPNNAYTSTFVVRYAALSVDGQQILTDQLGTLFAPSSPAHGGNAFLGSYSIKVPPFPSMGWIDAAHYSFSYVYPDGITRVRISGAKFEGLSDVAPGVPASPVTGQLIATVPPSH